MLSARAYMDIAGWLSIVPTMHSRTCSGSTCGRCPAYCSIHGDRRDRVDGRAALRFDGVRIETLAARLRVPNVLKGFHSRLPAARIFSPLWAIGKR